MSIKFKRIREVLKPKAYKEFCKYMDGQTVTSEGVPEDDFIGWMLKEEVSD